MKHQGRGQKNQCQGEKHRKLEFPDAADSQLHKSLSKLGNGFSVRNHQGNSAEHTAGGQGEYEKINSRTVNEGAI